MPFLQLSSASFRWALWKPAALLKAVGSTLFSLVDSSWCSRLNRVRSTKHTFCTTIRCSARNMRWYLSSMLDRIAGRFLAWKTASAGAVGKARWGCARFPGAIF